MDNSDELKGMTNLEQAKDLKERVEEMISLFPPFTPRNHRLAEEVRLSRSRLEEFLRAIDIETKKESQRNEH